MNLRKHWQLSRCLGQACCCVPTYAPCLSADVSSTVLCSPTRFHANATDDTSFFTTQISRVGVLATCGRACSAAAERGAPAAGGAGAGTGVAVGEKVSI